MIKKSPIKRFLLMLIPLGIGIGIFVFLKMTPKVPKTKTMVLQTPNVRVLNIQPLTIVPRGKGYGTAHPVRVWKAIAQVSGKIVYTHPELEKGKIIHKGEEVLRIDPTGYKIAVAQLEAKIENYNAQLKELDVQRKNNQQLLILQQKTLALQRKEVKRQERLLRSKVSSATSYETQMKNLMAQEVQVQTIQNSLNLYPVQRKLLKTQLEQARGDLVNAKLNLSYTRMRAPFDIQIAAINNKTSEFIQSGVTVFEANDISASEIEAQFIMGALGPVIHPLLKKRRDPQKTKTVSPLADRLDIKVKVKGIGPGNRSRFWDGEFSRLSGDIDTETRTMGAIVKVYNRFDDSGGLKNRPLIKGTFCEVELIGKPVEGAIVIPRNAIHPGNKIYLANQENRLEIRSVEVSYIMDELVVIKAGLTAGDVLILSDIIPAVEGTLVNPIVDKKVQKELKQQAGGMAL